ncbi:alpha/beta hydrolase [Roseibium sp. MMSF_3544]|uniref:alpha/beta hydrolase n=1 Tax=unclassified Roseibium TaxID=2629323 RepID=UPI00273E778C|nr:alpha/beta hydrolase [Roseibium sp. MMSF_3544]
MTDICITDWDDAYANAAHIQGAEHYPDRWAADAKAFRTDWTGKELDIVYGNKERLRLDLFYPEVTSKGLVVFVHGGYWLRFDKSYWSHFAHGALKHGWTVCLPSYELSPAADIAEITKQIGVAIGVAGERVRGPIRLSGHSAGGHLVTRMLCADTPLVTSLVERLEKTVSISGLHDLRPLRNTRMNEHFKLTETGATSESAALQKPISTCPVTAWVGAEERPEFIRQSRLLAEAWANATVHIDPEKHHFDVIDGLLDANSDLTRTLVSG